MATAEEEVAAVAAPPAPSSSDHKRKLDQPELSPNNHNNNNHLHHDLNAEPVAEEEPANEAAGEDVPDPKRPRLEDSETEPLAGENGHGGGGEGEEGDGLGEGEEREDAKPPGPTGEEAEVREKDGEADNKDGDVKDVQGGEVTDEGLKKEDNADGEEKPAEEGAEEPAQEEEEEHVVDDGQTTSRKMEVPNDKVGVLIGKGGETIRYLQFNSGAKIQITRDAEADPHSTMRPVELIGTITSIKKAEKLINAVIAEADAGGSPSLVARGMASVQNAIVGDQLEMQVPNEKVGLIIGRGGDTIKGLQARSGARIQLIPQHPPEGDGSKERTVRVTGDRRQIELAREMILDVMSQNVRSSSFSGGFSQQHPYRPRGPSGPGHWGPRGPHSSHSMPYEYQQRGPYPSQSHYPPSSYGGYPPQQMGPRSTFGSGWESRPPASMQGAHPHGGGYDYYSGHGGHASDHPSAPISSGHPSGPSPSPAMGPPHSQTNYNYGQPHGPEYGHQAPYSQTVPHQQSYGHGYDEPKYDSHAPTQHPYGHGNSQPVYPQAGNQPGYGAPQQYGKQPSYGMPTQGPPQQTYGPPRPAQPGDIPYQGAAQSSQPYGANVPSQQQQYPYASSGQMQQSYPPYGSASTTDGYSQAPPASGAGYPQQAPTVQAYAQTGGQQAAGYAQGPAGGYGSYPTSQGYPDQQAANNTGYGYQAPQDPAYGSGAGTGYPAPAGQQGYAQPAPAQPTYDQSATQSGAYAAPPASAPAAYGGKTVSPQPGYAQYDSTQMYAAPR
ncbi:hypothetical protein Tsubulata_034437 [Turnera subulata]|uniref:K Homology domain-containing protein n=1 Tax=Turnera subulata TaxID=218843 RepID=A0A9Q0G691_9ROSI|nr:hypothetical protein Tsubulata_034437 [Turnera subulata]